MRIAIVGAGLSGLATAFYLKRALPAHPVAAHCDDDGVARQLIEEGPQALAQQHPHEGRGDEVQDLPLPLPLAIAGAVTVLVVSFALLALAWREPRWPVPAPLASMKRPSSR